MTTDTITIPRDVFDAYQLAVALAREETAIKTAELDTANAWAGQLSLASDLQRADIGRLRAQLRQAADALRLAEADNAALTTALLDWDAADGTMEFADKDEDLAELARSLRTTMPPGARLVAELDAARMVIKCVRWAVDNHYAPPPLCDALIAYDKAMKARAG